MKTIFLVATGTNSGLTSVSLGLVRALEVAGLKVGFVKPISQTEHLTSDRSTLFARQICQRKAPDPIGLARVSELLSKDMTDQLMEEVIGLYELAAKNMDVVVVEGLLPEAGQPFVTQLNADMTRNLQADVLLVGSLPNDFAADEKGAEIIIDQIELSMNSLDLADKNLAGYILNRVPNSNFKNQLANEITKLSGNDFSLIGGIPLNNDIMAPRVSDVATYLNAQVLNEGDMKQRRVRDIVMVARSVPYVIELLKPGALIVTPGDRDDIILAAAIATMNGVPLAGLLITCDHEVHPNIAQICRPALRTGLPVLAVPSLTFETSTQLIKMDRKVPFNDLERMEKIINHVADHLDMKPLLARIGEPKEPRLTPPAFRHHLIEKARRAQKRIVLPEGNEPRTIAAAAICHEKGIAHCVLLGDPAEIREVAANQGVILPDDIEIIDPKTAIAHYVEPLVGMRKSKGMTAPSAEKQLEDTVMLGTVMLALSEVDGLVSGAVHTTANTVRPALQIIKTAPTAKLVSSVFFMLMPEQVLVYGDCAINPDPTAEELADIAIQSADSATAFGIIPRVAMISYSTGESGTGDEVEKVRAATLLVKEKRPDIIVDGPMQYDAASVESVGRQKAPNSPVAGRATVFVFPDLNTGNTTYKAVQRSANVISVGPMLQGLRKPVNDLSRGALVDDLVYTIALTAIQAEQNA
ncbi:phosphate acetyltransferase [Formosimonas limnophila]|uniref:Phosphate acetyltransferase n=1 Tax=Formosimonas limnophila TaxID=1384487 RepID=A0A8J3CH88_9BURK|nr:phosphate acetyltransferase [Formosimonas limnophila]GHA71202.1 phosphate acetyltransferase [Formosimonas limnophila]